MLSKQWAEMFDSVFMKGICHYNDNLRASLLKNACHIVNIEYVDYIQFKDSPFVKAAEQEIISNRLSAKRKKEEAFSLQIQTMKDEIFLLKQQLENFGFAWFGEKRRLKAEKEQRLAQLEAELHSTLNRKPIPSTSFVFYVDPSKVGKIERYNYPDWRVVYSERDSGYIMFDPRNRAVFKLPNSFTAQYGRYRTFSAAVNNWSLGNVMTMYFNLYEE